MYREGNPSICVHASTDHLLDQSIASTDPSVSNLIVPSSPVDIEQTGALNFAAAQNDSDGQDLELNVMVPVQESSLTVHICNSNQQVVGSTL